MKDSFILERKHIRNKVFKIGPSKICARQPSKNFTWSILEYFIPYKTLPDIYDGALFVKIF